MGARRGVRADRRSRGFKESGGAHRT
jgi:hypothetical protein